MRFKDLENNKVFIDFIVSGYYSASPAIFFKELMEYANNHLQIFEESKPVFEEYTHNQDFVKNNCVGTFSELERKMKEAQHFDEVSFREDFDFWEKKKADWDVIIKFIWRNTLKGFNDEQFEIFYQFLLENEFCLTCFENPNIMSLYYLYYKLFQKEEG